MIVDPDPVAVGLLRQGLEAVVPTAVVMAALPGVQAARERLTRQDIDLLCTETELPDGSGFDLLPVLRPGVGVVFVTGQANKALRAFEVGAADYLLKPVAKEPLLRAVQRAALLGGGAGMPIRPPWFGDGRYFLRNRAGGGLYIGAADIVAIFSAEMNWPVTRSIT